MLGLRASSQDMRRKFFQIYNKSIPQPLFDRLQFLICTQNWEKLAGTFWLKEALVGFILDRSLIVLLIVTIKFAKEEWKISALFSACQGNAGVAN